MAKEKINKATFADRLMKIRKKNGCSQRSAAERVHVAAPTWNQWESGRYVPRPIEVVAIALTFNCSYAYLTGKSKSDEPDSLTLHFNDLSAEDRDTIINYMNLSRADKECVQTIVNHLKNRMY